MRAYVVTVFPDLVEGFVAHGLLGKARARGRVAVVAVNPRDFTTDRHRSVDDTPYGGGSGMVMRPGPLVDAVEAAEAAEREAGRSRPRRVLMTPQGTPFRQADARRLASQASLTLVCARYEGIDERARRRCDEEISLGDFVLMGGEVAALAVLEAVVRLLPGVLGNPASIEEESHARGLLEHPHYTRPATFRGEAVPAVLLGGDHAAVARWRRREALRRTRERRPDLLLEEPLTDEDRAFLRALADAR
ncbi:MAG: tRNA (guanosine(37)-N1)-methyltransferase TrmD [Sandaracinaceae bacterium]